MGRATKFIIWFIVACVGLFVVTAIAFRLFFDPNDFREDIESAVRKSTGRELIIEGDISLKLFPWLAVEVGRTTLGNLPGFEADTLAEFDRAKLGVRMLPLLLRREVTIGAAEIDGLQLSFEVNAKDQRNWSDLIATDEESETDAKPDTGGRALDISGVDIRGATIHYVHRPKGDEYRLTDVNLALGRVSNAGTPVPASGSLGFSVKPAGYSGQVDIETSVSLDREAAIVTFGESFMQGVVDGIADAPSRIRFETAGIEVRAEAQTVTMQPVALSVLDIKLRANVETFSYADTITPTAAIEVDAFSPRSLMHQLGVEPPETADPAALSSLALKAKAQVRENDVALTGLQATFDGAAFRGSLVVPTVSSGRFRFDLSGESLDVNRYMAPAADGDVGAGGDAVPVEIPVDLVKALNASGKVRVAAVQLGALRLENTGLELTSQGGRLRVHPITADLYGGKYDGDVRIDASGATPVLSVNENVQGVDLARLALAMFEKKNITGSIGGNFKLSGRGADMGEVQRSLSGTMAFELKDGTYEGTDVWYELRRARALVKKETPPEPVLPARTKFSSVKATGVVTNGIMRNEDFVADLPFMQLTGAGNVNIPEGTVNYALKARIFRKPEAMGAATPEEIADFTKTVIPLKVTGPLASPKISPDVEGLLRQRVEEEIKQKVEDKLKDLFKR